jgi:AcrR family transcriptional regulator
MGQAEMFERDGSAQATLGQITASAGMTKGARYIHSASKDGPADAVQERGRPLLCDFVQGQGERGVAPVQALIDLTYWLAGALHRNPERLAACAPELPLILVNHYPLVRHPTRVLHDQEFAQWCGTELTADWHTRFPVRSPTQISRSARACDGSSRQSSVSRRAAESTSPSCRRSAIHMAVPAGPHWKCAAWPADWAGTSRRPSASTVTLTPGIGRTRTRTSQGRRDLTIQV